MLSSGASPQQHTRLLRLPSNEKFYPIQIDFFRAQAIVQIPDALANLVQMADRLQRRVAGFHGLNYNWINNQPYELKPLLNNAFGRFLWMHYIATGVLICRFCGVHYVELNR